MNCLFKKPGGFFVALFLIMSAHAAFDKHKLQSVVPSLKSSVMSALSEQEQELYRVCRPDPAPCYQIQKKIKSIKKDIQICCDGLEEKIDEIIKTVNTLDFCERPTVIDQAFMNNAAPQITQSGLYCLVEDVTGSLVIDADDVIIQMNDHRIAAVGNGIEITGHQNIAIQGSGTISGGMPNGILLTTCTAVVVSDIAFVDNQRGLYSDNVSGIRVANVNFTGHSVVSMRFINGSKNGKITCANMYNNSGSIGVDVDGCNSLVFDTCMYCNNNTGASQMRAFRVINNSSSCGFINCQVNNNVAADNCLGFFFNPASACYCIGCQFNNNVNSNEASNLDGFSAGGSEKIIFESCYAMNNVGVDMLSGRGFVMNNSVACCVIDCLAKVNTLDGFTVQGNSSTDNYLANNISSGNRVGYRLMDNGTNNIFFGNYGNQNATNFNVLVNFAPVFIFDSTAGTFSPVAPRINPVTKWDNIAVDKQ